MHNTRFGHHRFRATWLAAAAGGACILGAAVLHAQQAATAPAAQVTAGEPAEPPRPPAAPADGQIQPGALMDRAASNGAQIYVDDSFASIEKLRAANRYATQGQSQLAINAYQTVIDGYGQKLVYLDNDSYVSITDYVRRKLLTMPAVQSGMYDQLLGLAAQKEITPLVERRDTAGVLRACDRYFPSRAAFDGLSRAAEWYFERADFPAAARVWEELLEHPAANGPDPEEGGKRAQLLFRAALAHHMDRNDPAARVLRDQLQKEFPDAVGSVDGQSVNLSERLDSLLKIPAVNWAQDLPKDQWPQFQGGPTRAALTDANASIGAQLWTMDLRPSRAPIVGRAIPPIPNGIMRIQGTEVRPDLPLRLVSYPVLSEGTLYIHTGDRVLALSSNAGTPQWAYPQREPTRAEAMRDQIYQAQVDGENPYRPAAHQAVAVSGERAYAVLPASPAAANNDETDDNVLIPSTRVTCLDRKTGAEKWSTSARSIKLDSKGALTFIGSPLVTRDGVFVMARKTGDTAFVQLYCVRLDADTGAPAWSCYICSASGGAYYAPMMNFAGIPVPTFSDDMLYVSTGQGADCAVDANAGRIRWLQVTEAARKNRSPQDYFPPTGFAPSWKFNPPLVHGDRLITCEIGAETTLHLYNRWTGKLLRSFTNKDLEITRIDAMVGLVGSRVILTGTSCAALDLDAADPSAAPAWVTPMPSFQDAGPAEGRPFLAATALYVPFEKGMARIDPASGKSLDFWQWPKTQKDVAGKPGNLLVTSEQVVVVNDTDISGYSRWETARDNRLDQIRARPDNPEPYLALGEIGFRTNHLDLAEENMRRAVELAGAGANAEDILGRLYRTNLNFAEQLLAKTEPAQRDRARFYFEQCKATARSPEQQAEWRLSMSDLSVAQQKPEEAAVLYNQVLTDAALRAAPFRRGDSISRAGVTAEQKFRTMLDKDPGVYRRFEDQAAALLARAESQQDLATLQQIVDSYPNSNAAVTAATQLVNAYRDRQDWNSDLRVLRWLYRHAPDAIRGRVTADLAIAQLGLKRYGAALAWAERGLRQYPTLSWPNPAGQTSFASLRDQVRAAGQNVSEGRRPTMPAPQGKPDDEGPAMDAASLSRVFLANATLLPPVERSATLNRPDLLFAAVGDTLHLFDVATGKELTASAGIQLPEHSPAALLGSWGNISVLVQGRTIVGVDTTTHTIAWQVPLNPSDNEPRVNDGNMRIRVIAQPGGGQIIIRGNGRLMINGQIVSSLDAEMDPAVAAGAADPEVARQIAFSKLGTPAFSTVRMIDNKVLVAGSNGISAYLIDSGKPAWRDGNGDPLVVKTPGGLTSTVVGNEDLVVAQVDPQDHAGTAFIVLDAETGKFRKQIKLDTERALWRTVSDDGTLFAVTDQSVAAYDLFSDQEKPLWRRPDILSRFPYATVLTLDGLILVNRNSEVLCLAQDGGENRWPKPPIMGIRLDSPEQMEIAYERSVLDGDIVIFQSNGIFAGYFTDARSAGDQLVYRGTVPPEAPPLRDMQLSDRYLICLANGQSPGAAHAIELLMYDRAKTALLVTQTTVPTDPGTAADSLVLRSWQVLDNAIALEINGTIRLFRAKKTS